MEIGMIQLSIEEPSVEHFFNHSKEESINTLKFIADDNPFMGRTWAEIKIEQKYRK